MKKIIKIFSITSLSIIIMFIIYSLFQSPFTVSSEREYNYTCKKKPFDDSLMIYIPYKITISNNRFQSISLESIYDENYIAFRSIKNLIYNRDGIEIVNNFSRLNETKTNYFQTKYKKTIFPFTKRTFYYFKGVPIKYRVEYNNFDLIEEQLKNLETSYKINISKKTLDSLYIVNDKKRFNVNFNNSSYNFMPEYIMAKINDKKQKPVKIIDSLKPLKKKEQQDYLLKVARTNIKVLLNDF